MSDAVESNYKGEVLNCIRNGKGTYKYEVGGNGLFVYDGLWSNGNKNGSKGKFTMKGIHQVTGDFSNGEITGQGVKTWSDGRRYEGAWQNGEMHGKGDWISSNGDERYTGSFKDNKREGFGILVLHKAASIYRGNFSMHKKNGFGTFLSSNSFFLEANFIDNFIQGMVKVKWHKIASLTGQCKDGLFDNTCYYTAADGSYKYDGLFSTGLPLPHLEASYVYLQLDRTNAIVKILEEPIPVIIPGKKTPGSAKKTKIIEVEVQQLQIQSGCEVGKIIIRSGTVKDIDDYKRKLDEVAEAAVTLAATKGGKNTKDKNTPHDSEIIDPNCPPLSGRYNVLSETFRNVIVRIRPVISAESEADPGPSDTKKGAKKEKEIEKVYVPDTYGAYIPLWQRKQSQDKYGGSYNRFPLTSIAFIQGVRVTPGRYNNDELKGSYDDMDGGSVTAHSIAQSTDHSTTKSIAKSMDHGKSGESVAGSADLAKSGDSIVGGVSVNQSVSHIGSLATFIASSSAQLITASKHPGDDNMVLICHELTAPPTPPLSLSSRSSSELLDGPDITAQINPSVTLRVPYNELSCPEKSITFFIDYTLSNESLLDAFMAINQHGQNNENGSNGFTGFSGLSDRVVIPILNINKEYFSGIHTTKNPGGPGAPGMGMGGMGMGVVFHQSGCGSGTEELLQLALIVPATHFKMAAEQRKTSIAAKLKKEAGRLLAAESALNEREAAALAEAATAAAIAASSPKGKKEKEARKKDVKPEKKDDKIPKSPKLSFILPDALESKEVVVEEEEDEVFPSIDWTDCIWELRVVTTTHPVIPLNRGVSDVFGVPIIDGQLNGIDGMSGIIESRSPSPGIIPTSDGTDRTEGMEGIDGIEGSSSSPVVEVVSVQQWGCGTFVPSIWHSLALSARVPRLGEEMTGGDITGGEISGGGDADDGMGEEKGERGQNGGIDERGGDGGSGKNGERGESGEMGGDVKEKCVLSRPYFEIAYDGHGLVPIKSNNSNNSNNYGNNNSNAIPSALALWMLSSDMNISNYVHSPEDMLTRDLSAMDLDNNLATHSIMSALEIEEEPLDLGSLIPQVVGYVIKVGGEKNEKGSTGGTYGLPFQGSVKTLAVSGSGDRCDVFDITGCYSKYRAQEADWAALKRKEVGNNMKNQVVAKAAADAVNAANSYVENAAPPASVITPVVAPILSPLIAPTASMLSPILPLIPSDCLTVTEVIVTLIGGYGELDSLLLPAHTPPGRYVIEVSDGVSSTCLRYPAPTSTSSTASTISSTSTATIPPTSSHIPSNITSNISSTAPDMTTGNTQPGAIQNLTQDPMNKASLEDMKHLGNIVNPIKINQQIIFHAIPLLVPSV